MHPSVTEMWAAFLSTRPDDAALAARPISAWHFCDTPEDADLCAALVRDGRKCATSPSAWGFTARGEPLPQVGDFHVVTDWSGVAQCVIQTTAVEIVPFDRVTSAHAAAEGEGDGSLDHWRRTHRAYYERELAGTGFAPRDDMPIVRERFTVVYPTSEPANCANHPHSRRLATLADIPALFEVRTSVQENHLDLAQLAERGVTPASTASMLADSQVRVSVVEEERTGVVAFSMADARTGSLFALFVRPEAQGRGYGRALLAAAEAWLFGEGWETIWLQTAEESHFRAHSLYRRAGWTPAGPADHGDVRYEKRNVDVTEGAPPAPPADPRGTRPGA